MDEQMFLEKYEFKEMSDEHKSYLKFMYEHTTGPNFRERPCSRNYDCAICPFSSDNNIDSSGCGGNSGMPFYFDECDEEEIIEWMEQVYADYNSAYGSFWKV